MYNCSCCLFLLYGIPCTFWIINDYTFIFTTSITTSSRCMNNVIQLIDSNFITNLLCYFFCSSPHTCRSIAN
ncbi:hypothetical protein [Lysinibacillus antri]|uniref:hypothetical protein n=1 Tax=Lysinibacillus sp. BW-2-10 TaxID=2590030 RepID=UPI0034E081AE